MYGPVFCTCTCHFCNINQDYISSFSMLRLSYLSFMSYTDLSSCYLHSFKVYADTLSSPIASLSSKLIISYISLLLTLGSYIYVHSMLLVAAYSNLILW